MHETGIVRDLLSRAHTEAGGLPGEIASLSLRIGALSGITPEALRSSVDRAAYEMWGHRPALDIEESHDVASPDALGVVLVSIRLGE